jgi:hypothetical protein
LLARVATALDNQRAMDEQKTSWENEWIDGARSARVQNFYAY